MNVKAGARAIRELVELRGHRSCQEVADAVGVTRQAVRAWEYGVSVPNGPNLAGYAEALGITGKRLLEILREANAGGLQDGFFAEVPGA